MRITLKMLKAKHACATRVRRFEYHFGKGVTVTLARCVQHAHRFPWGWAAYNLLPGGIHGIACTRYYAEARKAELAYCRACDEAAMAYKAWAKYKKALKAARKQRAVAVATAFYHATKV